MGRGALHLIERVRGGEDVKAVVAGIYEDRGERVKKVDKKGREESLRERAERFLEGRQKADKEE